MDIPQEVRSRVAKVHDIPIEKIDALIEAAQLPPSNAQIKYMVDRFLGWRLPENFTPDAGISYDTTRKHEPVGTNLLDASQAEQMVRYMVEGINAPPPVDALVETIRNVLHGRRIDYPTLPDEIAAAVRQEHP